MDHIEVVVLHRIVLGPSSINDWLFLAKHPAFASLGDADGAHVKFGMEI